jgi:CubicO group peptidase (beta-lactamase class C family)
MKYHISYILVVEKGASASGGICMRRAEALFAGLMLLLTPPQALATDAIADYQATLDQQVPALLLRYGAPSAAIAVIHDGQTFAKTWGAADLLTGRLADEETLYNIASISKVVTAWSVMRLAQDGKIDLDAPVSRYVSRWRLPHSRWRNEVTVRRLLSHTAGLSMPSVSQYDPELPVPALEKTLSSGKDRVRIVQRPGLSTLYSGGGYGVLQLLVEEVSGKSFSEYVEGEILAPLGMTHSTFEAPAAGDISAAIPYDESSRALPNYRFAATGAAGLYTTVGDLAKLARASMPAGSGGDGPLSPSTIALMQTPVEVEKPNPYTGYGLGYSIVPMPAGGLSFGHSGSNDGWTAVFRTFPQSGDALVVLVNSDNGFPIYRDLMCDWVYALQEKKWPGFCDVSKKSWSDDDNAFVDSLFAGISADDPAVSVAVSTDVGAVYQKSFGSRKLGAEGLATTDTPFYIASLAKSLTALTALKLIEEGQWRLSDAIGSYIPELPAYAQTATVEQLLSHTSGLPDYFDLIEWGKPGGTSNATVVTLLEKRNQLAFPPGDHYEYSNTGYVLLAIAIERLTKRQFSDVLKEKISDPAGAKRLFVFDGRTTLPDTRAIGYSGDSNDGYEISDFNTASIGGVEYRRGLTTYGAGGIFASIKDLSAFDSALTSDAILALPLLEMAFAPRTATKEVIELPDTIGHGFGWFVSRRYDTNLMWNTGDTAGHKGVILRIPAKAVTVIILSSGGIGEPEALALKITDHLLERSD